MCYFTPCHGGQMHRHMLLLVLLLANIFNGWMDVGLCMAQTGWHTHCPSPCFGLHVNLFRGKKEQEEQKAGGKRMRSMKSNTTIMPQFLTLVLNLQFQCRQQYVCWLCMELTVFDYDAVSTKTLSTVGCWTRKRARSRYGNRARNRYGNRLCECDQHFSYLLILAALLYVIFSVTTTCIIDIHFVRLLCFTLRLSAEPAFIYQWPMPGSIFILSSCMPQFL